jgi:hypothetical protein
MSSPFIQKEGIDDITQKFGDLDVTLYWDLKESLSSKNVNAMYVFYSDVDEQSSNNNVGWIKHSVVSSELHFDSTRIELPSSFIDKRISYFIEINYYDPTISQNIEYTTKIFESNDNVVSSPSSEITINVYDGRSTLANEENVYYLNISDYDDTYGNVYFSASKVVNGTTMRVNISPRLPLANNDESLNQFILPVSPIDSKFIRMEDITMDVPHEISVYYKSGFLNSPLSNTRIIYNTKKLLLSSSDGKSPRIIINDLSTQFNGNIDGKVKFMTNFDNTNRERSPESSLKLLLFLIKENEGSYTIPPLGISSIFKELDILNLLYDVNHNPTEVFFNEYNKKVDFGDIFATIEIDGANSEDINSGILQYNQKYKLAAATQTDQLTRTELLTEFSTPVFCIQKTPVKPTINQCYLLQVSGVSLHVNWTNGEMFNNDVNKYSLKITYLNQGIETELEGLTPNISLANSDAVYSNTANFTSGREYKVYVRTHVLDLNIDGALLESEWSTPVTFTYYRRSEFTSLNLSVDKNIANVNSKAMLSWDIANTSGLSIEKFILYKDVVGDNNFTAFPELSGTTFNYSDIQLTNGTTYNYKVQLSLRVKSFSNIPILGVETIISSVITFRPWTLPEKPAINDCYLSQYNSNNVLNVIPPLNVNWTNGFMYNSDVHSYSLKITYLNEGIETELEDLEYTMSLQDSSGSAVYSNTADFTSGRQYKFYVKTNVLDLNNAVDLSDNTLVLSSDWSTYVNFTYYRISEFTSLNLSVDKNKSNVDSKAMLSWNKPNSSNVDLYRFELYRAINSADILKLPFNLNNASFSYEDTGLTNGDTYSYLLKTFIEVTEFRNSVANFNKNEWIISSPVSIIPWKLPGAPALSLSNWDNNVGNRYVDLRLLALNNYMKNYINGYNVRYKLNSSQDYEINQYNNVSIYDYNVRIGNIVNEQLYDFNANVIYSDPNVSGESHPTSYSDPNLQVTPTAIKNDYNVTNLVFSEIGDEKVKVTWVKPVLVDANASNNLNPSIVGDNRTFKRYEINVFEKNLSNNFVLVYTLNDDGSVLSLINSNTLTYTFDKKLNSDNQKVLVNGKTYKFSVSVCYDSESSTPTETVKNETLSNVEIYPYMTYSATNLRYTSKNYDDGAVNFNYLYSTNDNNNVNYLTRSEIWVNDVQRYIITKANTLVNTGTAKVLARDVFLPSGGGIVDERQQKVVVRLVFDNPNKTIVGEPSTTHADSSAFYVRSYKRPDNLSLTGSNVTNSSVQLNWIFPSTSFEYSIFRYNLRWQTDPMTWFNTTANIPRLSRSFNLTGLDNEKTYRIGIFSTFTDLDNNQTQTTTEPVTVTIRTHLPSPTDLTFQEYIASDKTISLKFNTPSTIIGLNTSNYKIHYKPTGSQSSYTELLLSELNSSGKFVNGFYLITGLTNGTQYEFYYSAQLDNSVNVEEGQDAILTTKSILGFSTPLKEADPVDDINVVDHVDGLTISLSWNSPELNGSIFKEYKLYKKLQGTSDWTLVTVTTASGHTFTANSTDFNNVYEFYVIVITRDVNTNALLDSSESNVVSHHFFEAPKIPSVLSDVFVSTKELGNVSYSVKLEIGYEISSGLSNPLFDVLLDGNQHSTHTPSLNAEHKYIVSLSDLDETHEYSVKVRVHGNNPNNSLMVLSSDYSEPYTFKYFSNPVLENSSVVVVEQEQSLLVKINEGNNSLNLMNTIFQYYLVNIYDGENDKIYTNNISREVVNDLIIYNLINGVSYKVYVTPISISPLTGSSEIIEGNTIEKVNNVPETFIQTNLVPVINSCSVSSNRLTFVVDTKGLPLLGWYLFFQYSNLDHQQKPRYNQFLYRSPSNSISSTLSDNTVTILIDVLKDLNDEINKKDLSNIEYSFVTYNTNGRSEYNYPDVIYNPDDGTGNYIMYANAGKLSDGPVSNII